MKQRLWRIIVGAAVFAAAYLLKIQIAWIALALYLASYLIVGGDVLFKAVRNLCRGKMLDENLLMTVATIGAFCIAEYPEAVAVMLFYQIGELFQSYAVNKSRKSIASLMDIRPDYANRIQQGNVEKVDPGEILVGEEILVRPGEKVPLDGIVLEGSSMLDTSAITGEPVPRTARAGDHVISGCVNLEGTLTVRVEKEFGESTVSKILDLVENASVKKSNSENFITRFAAVYTPVVVIAAVLLAVLPPLLFAQEWGDWVKRALNFLVVSCPCALVISIPLSFFGGIGGASRAGILVKGSNYLEALERTECVVFDKTGTLTKGEFAVQSIVPSGISEEQFLQYAAYVECDSNHPISISLKNAYGEQIDPQRVCDTRVISGCGVSAVVEGKRIDAGNAKLMRQIGVVCEKTEEAGTIVHMAIDGVYAGYAVIADALKEDAPRAIRELKAAGVKMTAMLTGDNVEVANHVAKMLLIDRVYAGLLPPDKVERMEQFLKEKSEKGKLVFVGDGINDAPVLARADIGVSMGKLASDAAIEAADIVIMTDEPSKLATAIKISKKTMRIVRENIAFALSVKIAVLALSAAGLVGLWAAVFADVGVSVLAVLNALRALRTKHI